MQAQRCANRDKVIVVRLEIRLDYYDKLHLKRVFDN